MKEAVGQIIIPLITLIVAPILSIYFTRWDQNRSKRKNIEKLINTLHEECDSIINRIPQVVDVYKKIILSLENLDLK